MTVAIQQGFEKKKTQQDDNDQDSYKQVFDEQINYDSFSFCVLVLWHWILSAIAVFYGVYISYRSLQLPLLAIN